MNLLRRYVRTLLEAVTQAEKIENLQPEDVLLVYHGTGGAYLSMIHGIDATSEHHREYGGQRHEGLFITTDPDTALRFASHGGVVFEIETKAKNLYGTDYSGRTTKKQTAVGMPDPNKLWHFKYPNSFRPYLTATLLQKSEPQALFVGVVRPQDIKRVQWKGTWYSREELLNMMPEYYPPYEKQPKKLKRMAFDPTDGNITLEEFYKALTSIVGKESLSSIQRVINTWLKNAPERLPEKIEDLGWRRSAAHKIAQMIISRQQSQHNPINFS